MRLKPSYMTVAMGIPGKNRSEDYPENLLTPLGILFAESLIDWSPLMIEGVGGVD